MRAKSFPSLFTKTMFDYKRLYYYVITTIAFFVLLWGSIDFSSAGLSFVLGNQVMSAEKDSQPLDEYYSKKMVQERLGDSFVRIMIGGGVFLFCKKKIEDLEGGKSVS